MDLDFIRALWRDDEVEYTDEAVRRMRALGVSRENIGEAVRNGGIVEERPDALLELHDSWMGRADDSWRARWSNTLLIIAVYWERIE